MYHQQGCTFISFDPCWVINGWYHYVINDPYVDASLVSMFTSFFSVLDSGIESYRYNLVVGILYVDIGGLGHFNSYPGGFFPRSITASIIVVCYFFNAEILPNGICKNISAIFTTITIHIGNICECVFTWRYNISRSIFPIIIRLVAHFSLMALRDH